jgi:hypothetical protein
MPLLFLHSGIHFKILFIFQALNGFVFMVTCDGEVFFASRTVEQYLGFHQVRQKERPMESALAWAD